MAYNGMPMVGKKWFLGSSNQVSGSQGNPELDKSYQPLLWVTIAFCLFFAARYSNMAWLKVFKVDQPPKVLNIDFIFSGLLFIEFGIYNFGDS